MRTDRVGQHPALTTILASHSKGHLLKNMNYGPGWIS